ncbi:Spo0E family sporulation regulatory protein-aspartic acid phosphatase [Clostridium sp. YIM B02555]|uniref:Spo0E family sporulation regulatory protein-aspartic acid phosphatase n=1 Tax=Clostridium sp. YIM B02555 TaxID=2911968 RepID=UPI001EEE8FFA|nr:Spo0E family sporulation regulatory protein-aspartic acid phosphatase [Clostridium sp. YIM B02555]
MDDLISYNIDMYRDMLHIEIANNKELTNDYVLKLSQKLDKAIIAAYKEQLNTNSQ